MTDQPADSASDEAVEAAEFLLATRQAEEKAAEFQRRLRALREETDVAQGKE